MKKSALLNTKALPTYQRKPKTSTEGIGESIRPGSLLGPPRRRNPVLEAAPKRAQCTLCQFRSATHPRRGDRSGFNGKLELRPDGCPGDPRGGRGIRDRRQNSCKVKEW